jgi:hypothetical protein
MKLRMNRVQNPVWKATWKSTSPMVVLYMTELQCQVADGDGKNLERHEIARDEHEEHQQVGAELVDRQRIACEA